MSILGSTESKLTILMSLALAVTFCPPAFAASGPVSGTDISAALAQETPPTSRNNNKNGTTMKQDETIRSQKERQARGPEYDRLEVLIGKWINVGKTERMGDEPPLDITASDVYEWLPGKYWILHTAYGRIGKMDVGGVEIIGYDRETGKYISHFYDSRGNSSEGEIIIDANTMTWKSKTTACTSVFTENGKVQTGHHVRLDENGRWVPSMEVVLTKVR
jgi:Protein of unknown function (DUF1579)